jgi:SagB-type dehydrogenase family enzyme
VTGLAPFESSIAERYHEETKYSEGSLLRAEQAALPHNLMRQPSPFKTLDGPRILLPTQGLPLERRGSRASAFEDYAPPGHMDLAKLARILWHTNGCTRITQQAAGIHVLRAAPSAGGLYPTEVYVAVRGIPGLEAGIYDYQVLDHTLVIVRPDDPMPQLFGAAFGHPAMSSAEAVLILTAEWYRNSWRYRERGYRRALLDTGHVLGNAVEVAPCDGFEAIPIACFRDAVVETLLGVEPAEEGPLVLVALVDAERAASIPPMPQRRSPVTEWRKAVADVANRVEGDTPERLIAAVHVAGRLAHDAAAVPPAAAPTASLDATVVDADSPPTSWSPGIPVTATIATRRSTRTFRDEPIERAALFRALAHAYPVKERHLFAPEILRSWLVAVAVDRIPPGTYLYEPATRRLVERSRGDCGDAMQHLGLGQEIFVNAAAALIHTVDLTRAVERYGDRVYRLVNLDAGQVGERLNLALLREGLGVSGCGGYFDDEMNRVLAIPESQAVVYITAIGAPAG